MSEQTPQQPEQSPEVEVDRTEETPTTPEEATGVPDTPAQETPAEKAPSAEAPVEAPVTDAPVEAPVTEEAEAPAVEETVPAEHAAPAAEQTTPQETETPAVEEPVTTEPEAPVAEQATEEQAAEEQAAEEQAAEEQATPATEEAADEAPAAPEAPEAAATPAAPKPGPRPGAPSPAMFASRRPAAPRPAAAGTTTPDTGAADMESGAVNHAAAPTVAAPAPPSDSVKHGRVGEDGTVYVIAADGSERAVGSYPDVSAEEALAYFARKYDELAASADLFKARLASTDVSAHDARQSLAHLKEQIGEAHVVGDLAALEATVTHLEKAVAQKSREEQEARVAAKAQAAVEREAIVAEAEKLAATDPARMQWKQGSARVRELLDVWKGHQRSGPRLDKDVENGLWQRFSAARSSFDKSRKAWFAQLDDQHAEAKRLKEKLVAEAETLSTSKDWGPTAGAFKRLMQEWKRAGRASRADDDALWNRFKAAQDSFFNAKDEVVAAEEAEFTENLKVKEALLVEAEAITVDEAHLDQAKAELRRIQDKWDAAGKVPRADIRRVEGRLRAVEQQVRDLEDTQWKRSDPELTARAQSMADQLERAVQGLESDLAAARAAGDDKRAGAIEAELATKRVWLDSARGNLS